MDEYTIEMREAARLEAEYAQLKKENDEIIARLKRERYSGEWFCMTRAHFEAKAQPLRDAIEAAQIRAEELEAA